MSKLKWFKPYHPFDPLEYQIMINLESLITLIFSLFMLILFHFNWLGFNEFSFQFSQGFHKIINEILHQLLSQVK